MKRKLTSLLLVLLLAVTLTVPALASQVHGALYSDADTLITPTLRTLGTVTLPDVTEQTGIDIRVDIYEAIGQDTLAEMAEYIYNEYDYGAENGGVSLSLYVAADASGYLLTDGGWCVCAGGNAALQSAVEGEVAEFLTGSAWGGDLAQDQQMLTSAVTALGNAVQTYAGASDDAAGQAVTTSAQLGYVTDDTGLLTDRQISRLEQRCAALAQSSGVGVYIRTVNDYADYGFGDVETASYTLYHNNDLGVGDGRDGILLLLSMSNRKYATFVYGDKAERIFPGSALQRLEDGFLDDFRNDDWYEGFCDYIDGCAGLLSGETYTGGDSDYVYDAGFSWELLLRNFVIALVIACVIALIVCLILKAKMRSVHRQTEARAYVTPAGLHLTRRDDVYTHTTTTRRKIERDNSGSGGGSSGGFSGGGGHGRSGSF